MKTTVHSRCFSNQTPVSEIGMGTWTMGGMWGPRDDRAAIDALVCAFEQGIDFIDTALVYGNGHSEGLIASAVRESKFSPKVATKIPPQNHRWPGKSEYGLASTFNPEHIILSTEQSLKNLRTDHVFLQQLHVWHDDWLSDSLWDEVCATVLKLKEQGKIKYFGVSINDHAPETALKIVSAGVIESVQVIYNIFDQSPEKELFPLCKKNNVAVIVRVPFDEGSLAGKIFPEMTFHPKDWRFKYFTKERLQETCARVEKIKELVLSEGFSLPEAALKFCLSHEAVTTVIPGMRRAAQVKECAAVSSKKEFSRDLYTELKKCAWPRNFYPF